MRSCLVFLISYFLFLSSFSHVYASGLTVSPAYQDITASSSGQVTYTNQTENPITLTFSLQQIIATDLLGRLKFNAPLPQTLQATDPELAIINPNELIINPGESASISAQFNPASLDPGTTAFLLLAKINSESAPGTNLNQYLGSSILVTALGSHTAKLELIKTSLSLIPLHFSHPDFIQLTLKNTGNTRSIARGTAIITDIFGREIMRGAINDSSAAILPGSQRLIYTHLQPSQFSWPINIHQLKLTGTDDVGQSRFQFTKTYLYFNPYLFPLIGFLVALCLILKYKFHP